MKRYVTHSLKTIAAIWMSGPLVYPVALSILFDIPLNQFVRVIISPLYFIVAILTVTAGYGLWEMKRWSWYAFLISNIVLIYANVMFGWDQGTSHHKGVAFGIALVFHLSVLLKISREVRVPWFFPKIHWWESDPRYKLSVSATITRIGGHQVSGEILDISNGGCFIKVRADLLPDELIKATFGLQGVELICDGFVVWRTQSTVTHPKGVGVKFASLGKRERRSLKIAIRRLRRANLDRQKERLGLGGSQSKVTHVSEQVSQKTIDASIEVSTQTNAETSPQSGPETSNVTPIHRTGKGHQ